MLNNLRVKRVVKKETQYLVNLKTLATLKDPTPESDEAMVRYLIDSIAWLDSFDEKPAAKV
jgi:hypothetical protein